MRIADKTASTHFKAARGLCKFPFELGAKALNITHAVFDRAIFSAQDRLLRQAHEQSLAELRRTLAPGEADLLHLQSWYVSSGCCHHDGHGGLKWSLHPGIDDT